LQLIKGAIIQREAINRGAGGGVFQILLADGDAINIFVLFRVIVKKIKQVN